MVAHSNLAAQSKIPFKYSYKKNRDFLQTDCVKCGVHIHAGEFVWLLKSDAINQDLSQSPV
jgi:hypothetical protein